MKDEINMMARRHGACALLLIVSIVLFWSSIRALLAYSWTHESSSHIVLIPALAIFLIYAERQKIFLTVRSSPLVGLTLICAGIALYVQAKRLWPLENENQFL